MPAKFNFVWTERNEIMRHYCNRQTPRKSENSYYGTKEVKAVENSDRGEKKDSSEQESKNAENDEVVFPPGCGCDYLKSSGIAYKIYGEEGSDEYGEAQGGAFSQSGAYNKQESEDMKRENTQAEAIRNKRAAGGELIHHTDSIIADNMSGSFRLMSVPQISAERQLMSMPDYLDRYRGKYICLDLWTNERRRIEKCGVLSEVGIDFLSIKNPRNGDITMIDLRTVRYISIYCR